MPKPVRDTALAARVLAEWAREAFTRASLPPILAKYEVGERTVYRWKADLDKDRRLAAAYKERLDDLLDLDWADTLNAAIAETIARLRALIADAEDLDQATRAFAALSEVALTKEILRGALDAEQDRSLATEDRPSPRVAPIGPN